ncbi:unnamed protein product [Blepharisma stoltei]|uniref:Uncharacterized protein n=1 Tax=Blepharisma stoltei TaxID=1481888 RepID=A0AAU9KGC9_9CILI|nr:unnamed protein product [Blepharisma stoltei]
MSITLLRKYLAKEEDEPSAGEIPVKRKRTFEEIYAELLQKEKDKQILRPEKQIKKRKHKKVEKMPKQFKSKLERIEESDISVDPKALYEQNLERLKKKKPSKISQEIIQKLTRK